MRDDMSGQLTIRDVVARTGVAAETLRVWERRYGVPAPSRLASGHRRYSELDVEIVRRAASERDAGATLKIALARAAQAVRTPPTSLFAILRQRHPELAPRLLRKPILIALSRAIEDESLSRAERPVLFASFQRERYYRQAERRWGELAAFADSAIVFADFAALRTPAGRPCEIPISNGEPLIREWAVVCVARGHAVCLAAWEPTTAAATPERDRQFETVWSVEPAVVIDAARTCAAIAAARLPSLAAAVLARLDAEPAPAAADQLRLAGAITGRALTVISAAG
jgi:DICT domain-containing protein